MYDIVHVPLYILCVVCAVYCMHRNKHGKCIIHVMLFENRLGQFDDEPYPNLLPVTQLNVPPVVQDETQKDSEKDNTIKQGMYLYVHCGQEKLHYYMYRTRDSHFIS